MPYTPNDPLYVQQLHFINLGLIDGQRAIERIWDDYRGDGIYVMVYDTGVDYTHVDLDGQFDHTRDVVINGVAQDGSETGESHGTIVAGLIGAENNGIGVVGIAFNAEMVSYNGILVAGQNYDVVNMSYGIYGYYVEPLPDSFPDYLQAAQQGRGGLGTIMVTASGNEHIHGSADPANNLRWSISVSSTETAAATRGNLSDFSNYGSGILVSAPGRDLSTDLAGARGDNTAAGAAGDYITESGTSFSAPVLSGVIALMLDANPALGWRDVQDIIAAASTRSGSAMLAGPTGDETSTWVFNNANSWNGGGYHVSNDYGYGQINVFNAVRMAEAYAIIGKPAQTSANEQSSISAAVAGGTGDFVLPVNVTGNLDIDHVVVDLSITDTRFDLLTISITSPDGHTVVIHDGTFSGDAAATTEHRNAAADGIDWSYLAQAYRGENSAGAWEITVDDRNGNNAVIDSARITIYGSAPDNDDVYVFTDEFFAMRAVAGQAGRSSFSDASGNNWFNGAALVRNLVLNMNVSSASTYNGQAFITTTAGARMFGAIAGDGNDQVTGNALGNSIHGMRGKDTLSGQAGNDTLNGGAGFDTMTGGLNNDVFDFNAVAEIGNAAGSRDVITDFQKGADKIDLDGIDALSTLAGVQHFTWLGTAAHTGAGATLRYQQAGGNTLIFADTNANGGADFTLQLNGLVNLAASDFTNLSIAAIQGTAGNDVIAGTASGKLLTGLAGNDTITGGAGTDTVRGGAGTDSMAGGGAADRFDFDTVAEIGNAAGARDIVTDFQPGVDLIDFDGIDALSTLAGVQHFTWLGTAAHTGAGATLRYQQTGGNTLIFGDTNANGAADFTLQLNGLHALSAASFTNLSIATIQGTAGNDTLTGAPGGKIMSGLDGNDTITGGTGNDTIIGGAGVDVMSGAAGADQFRYASAAHTGVNAGARDIINGFQLGIDRIDLSGIDANSNVAGNQAFVFLGTAAHTGAGATLRFQQSGASTLIFGDINGDTAADFAIQLNGLYTLIAGDFVL